MENAHLKKLNALVQAKEQSPKKINSVMENLFDIMKSKCLYLKEFESIERFKE